MIERTVATDGPLDLGLVLGPLRFGGSRDPCLRIDRTGVWRASTTAAGPATVRLRQVGPDQVKATAWGSGAEAALDAVPDLIGAADDQPPLARAHPLVRELERRFAGLRLGRSNAVLEALVPTVLAQKVIGLEARAAFVALVRAAGRRAPGPTALLLPPEPRWLASLPSWAFHRWGVEHRRAATIKIAAAHAGRVEECTRLSPAEARRRLGALPGVGVWTINEVCHAALGDPDAVSVGDYWLKHVVSYALTGEPRGTDQRMLELLEPWRGQRGRVCRLLMLGAPRPPRYGPRLSLQGIAAY